MRLAPGILFASACKRGSKTKISSCGHDAGYHERIGLGDSEC